MIIESTDIQDRTLNLKPSNVSVVANENDVGPTLSRSFVLTRDADDTSVFSAGSIPSHSLALSHGSLQPFFEKEFLALCNKTHKYSQSTTHLTHLSSLAALAGRHQQALAFLRTYEETAPDDFVRHKIGELLISSGQIGEFFESSAANEHSHDIETLLQTAYAYLVSQNAERAVRSIRRAFQIDVTDPRVHLFAGALCMNEHQYALAIQNFRRATRYGHHTSSVYVNLALSYYWSNNLKKALTNANIAITLNPLDLNAISLFSEIALRLKRYDLVINTLRDYIDKEPTSDFAWSRLAQAYYEDNQLLPAQTALEKEYALNPSSTTLNNLGVVLWRRDKHAGAVRYFYKAITGLDFSDDSTVIAYCNLVSLLCERKDYSKALELCESFLEHERTFDSVSHERIADLYALYVSCLLHFDHIDSAIAFATQLLESDTAANTLKARLLVNLISYFCLQTSDRGRALGYTELATDLLYDDLSDDLLSKLTNNVVFSYIEFNHFDRAAPLLGLLSKYLHIDAMPTATFGLWHLRKLHIGKGIKYYEEAMHLCSDPKDRERVRQKLNLELARAYASSNDVVKARLHVKRALKTRLPGLDALHSQAKSLYEQLK